MLQDLHEGPSDSDTEKPAIYQWPATHSRHSVNVLWTH